MTIAQRLVFCVATLIASPAAAQVVVDFEELTTFTDLNPAGGGSFFNGNDGAGTTNSDGWASQGVRFSNDYNGDSLPAFDYWEGWSYSNVANATTPGFTNQYAAAPGGGSDGAGGVAAGQNYALAFGSAAYFDLPENARLRSVEVANSTYAALTMLNGDSFAKKFGGDSGDDPDLFQVTLTGYDGPGATGGMIASVTVDLADYRFADNGQDFVLDRWRHVDLAGLGGARSVGLSFFSTDSGDFGINTPTYLAVDNLTYTIVPEPSGMCLLALACAGTAYRRRRRRD
jgi:hypothetical protein